MSLRINHLPRFSGKLALLMGALALAAALGAGQAAPAMAADAVITVNSFEDKEDSKPGNGTCNNTGVFDGKCSLRAAIQEANANNVTHTIKLTPGTYVLETGKPVLKISQSLTIKPTTTTGRALVHNPAGRNLRLFDTSGTAEVVTLTLERLDLRFGRAPTGCGGAIRSEDTLKLIDVTVTSSTAADGGGVCATGTLELTDSVIEGNTATNQGGGIKVFLGGGTITNSTINGNSAPAGGGIFYNVPNQTVFLKVTGGTITNNTSSSSGAGLTVGSTSRVEVEGVTFQGNKAELTGAVTEGGGILNLGKLTVKNSGFVSNRAFNGAGIQNSGQATVTNSTFTQNVANQAGSGINNLGALTLNNVTISANLSTGSGQAAGLNNTGTAKVSNTLLANHPAQDCNGTIVSGGFNLVEFTNTCTITGDTTGNITGQDPLTGTLAGTPPHLVPNIGSAAIDAGSPATPGSGGNACETTDQRGVARPKDGNLDGAARCDIGAVEVQLQPTVLNP